jgi:dynein intermediate chain 2
LVPNFYKFLDWSVKLWLEELRGPLTQTQFSPSLLTCGGWSPTRAGVFYACRQDGIVDFWDYHYRMNEVAYSHKVTDYKLTSASIHPQGALMAVGDMSGTVTLIKLCQELANSVPSEKNAVGATLERESRREKNLESLKKQQAILKAQVKPAAAPAAPFVLDAEKENQWLKELGLAGN